MISLLGPDYIRRAAVSGEIGLRWGPSQGKMGPWLAPGTPEPIEAKKMFPPPTLSIFEQISCEGLLNQIMPFVSNRSLEEKVKKFS